MLTAFSSCVSSFFIRNGYVSFCAGTPRRNTLMLYQHKTIIVLIECQWLSSNCSSQRFVLSCCTCSPRLSQAGKRVPSQTKSNVLKFQYKISKRRQANLRLAVAFALLSHLVGRSVLYMWFQAKFKYPKGRTRNSNLQRTSILLVTFEIAFF